MATIPTHTHPSSERTAKTQRRYTVGYLPNHGDTSTPTITLSGKWLREAGFDTGRGISVHIAGDCIVLIPDNDEAQALREELKEVKATVKDMRQKLSVLL
ncbi:type I addiction module toxin, SymE family [Atlantibacter subterranea]|uniref:SymE family type I addiction module toxin n=1 Tax=Atlantibacter subterraneus TaxID=255519 RepID=UPI001183B077|nr:SymE family type I addiction module toxin [Atlantibacter subterranea]TSJ59706.1 type I addiction module toxin, SymE family [Atlantibacter subterranea]